MVDRSFIIRETRLRKLYRLLAPTTDPEDVTEGYESSLTSEITANEDSMIFETGYLRQLTSSVNPEHIIEGDEQSPIHESNTSATTEDSAGQRARLKLGFDLLSSAFAWMQAPWEKLLA